jgi:hypothetical protein
VILLLLAEQMPAAPWLITRSSVSAPIRWWETHLLPADMPPLPVDKMLTVEMDKFATEDCATCLVKRKLTFHVA